MSTTDIATMLAADLREAWAQRENDRGNPHRARGGSCSRADHGTRVKWSLKGKPGHVEVYRSTSGTTNKRLVWRVSDPITKTRRNMYSQPEPLGSWDELDKLVDMLDGTPLVPRADAGYQPDDLDISPVAPLPVWLRSIAPMEAR